MSKAVSVVIPTYNGSAFVASGIESVWAQTELPAEIVVVDDASTDNTAEAVASLAVKSPVPIRFIPLPQNSGGAAKPINSGIEAARSDVIALLDQDDLMKPRRIELQSRALEQHPECPLVIGRFSIIDREEDDVSPLWSVPQLHDLEQYIDETQECSVIESQAAFKPLLSRNYAASCSNFCFPRNSWAAIGRFDETVKICIDLDFMLRATMSGPLAIVNEKIFEYRWASNSHQRRDITRSLLEATMVRLRAASQRPEWASDDLEALRYSALIVANAAVRKGDFNGLRAIAETLAKHKGLQTVRDGVNKRTRRVIDLFNS